MALINSPILLLHVVVSLCILFDSVISLKNNGCICSPQPKNFNESISGNLKMDCPKCFKFTYDFTHDQEWAAQLCVQSEKASTRYPLFVVVRESLNVMSFQVPVTFPGANPYSDVCKTLCPLANYNDSTVLPGQQSIMIEVSASREVEIDFNFELSKLDNFIITNKTITVNITASKPSVLQYNMEEDLHAVRIEATSEEDSCMVLGLQDIQCPIYYSVESVEPQGYYQTLTRQSGISITRNTFKNGRQYIVLLLKPTDELCFEADKKSTIISKNHQKTVMVRVFPSITDEEFNKAIFGTLGFYVLIYIFSFIICCFFFVRQKKATPEQKKFNIENPNIQNYGTSSGSNSQSLQNFPFPHSSDEAVPLLDAADKQAHVDNSGTVIVDVASSSTSPSPSAFQGSNAQSLQDFPFHHPSVWTFIIHLLGCSSRFHKSGQLLDADKRVFLSDLAINEDKYFSDRTKVYSWNLLTIAIFYGLPVIQLVYINQGFVNVTGNQDLCYYNFLCSHQVGLFSDFNHIYSNIGYVMLGILFLLLVLRRDLLDKSEMGKENVPQSELCGIPRHYGLMYAMGWALIMEGVLSGSYHTCPNETNFQFDTAFMYVIATLCMLKLYQSRHPDITAKSHTTWIVLSVVIILGFGGVVGRGLFVWIPFVIAHVFVTIVVSAKIYYMGRWKLNCSICRRKCQSITPDKIDVAAPSTRPIYSGRFIILSRIAVLLNFSLDIVGIILQPPNFGICLLSIFVANLLMYLVYYSFMKIWHKEGIRWIPIMYFVLACICWVPAICFFEVKNTSWEVTPAESRERNKHCIIFNFFDHHDVWHFLSSCAIFFSYMVLFTLDDNLNTTPRSRIRVF